MNLFVIHRFKDRKHAKSTLKRLAKDSSSKFNPIFLYSNGDEQWKEKAAKAIKQSEAVIVYNREACEESDNAKWEIEKAKETKKEIIDFYTLNENADSISKLNSLYEFKDEFDACFPSDSIDVFKLYKLMLESSENLIQRRQRMNAFFITVIGSLLSIAGLLVKTATINIDSIGILYGFSVIGLLLCNSWRNLLDNYGKLNKAKYDVILRLEKSLDAQIYWAEWLSLGKGLRPKKYKSFTSTEKNVPLLFALLIGILTFIVLAWQISS